jgi:hypothetical protein
MGLTYSETKMILHVDDNIDVASPIENSMRHDSRADIRIEE